MVGWCGEEGSEEGTQATLSDVRSTKQGPLLFFLGSLAALHLMGKTTPRCHVRAL